MSTANDPQSGPAVPSWLDNLPTIPYIIVVTMLIIGICAIALILLVFTLAGAPLLALVCAAARYRRNLRTWQ